MSQQELDLRRLLQAIRRHWLLVTTIAVLGLAGGAAFTVVHPPMLTSKTLVWLPTSTARSIGTQVVIAGSDPVLRAAQRHVDPPDSLSRLRAKVHTKSVTSNVIEIDAQAKTADQAEDIANAIADSYVTYLDSRNAPGGRVLAQVLQRSTSASKSSLVSRLALTGVLGILLGALVGIAVTLAISRSDRRLRKRDEIADSIGVPVLASIPVSHPSGPAGWVRLLEDYEPGVVHAWSLRKTLQYLGLADVNPADLRWGVSSLAVLSMSSDPRALALGPQLAVYAARIGIPTALVIGPQQDPNITATLRAACAAPELVPPRRPARLRVSVADFDGAARTPDAVLTVVVGVVDSQNPRVAATMRAAVTVLGVSTGTVSAEQLARVAAGAAADGRQIAGILVADPDPSDHTTGRLPQPGRASRRRMPTRLTGISMDAQR